MPDQRLANTNPPVFVQSDNFLMHVDDLLLLRNVDAGQFAETIICGDCAGGFGSDTQYLNDGRYIGYCDDCDNFEYFSNSDILEMKSKDSTYPYVYQLVKYHVDNNLCMTIASVYEEYQTDGCHRLKAALQLGLEYVWVTTRASAIYDTVEDWTSRSPAFSGTLPA